MCGGSENGELHEFHELREGGHIAICPRGDWGGGGCAVDISRNVRVGWGVWWWRTYRNMSAAEWACDVLAVITLRLILYTRSYTLGPDLGNPRACGAWRWETTNYTNFTN